MDFVVFSGFAVSQKKGKSYKGIQILWKFSWRLAAPYSTQIVLVLISFRSSGSVPLRPYSQSVYHTRVNLHVTSAGKFMNRSRSDVNAFPITFWFITPWSYGGCASKFYRCIFNLYWCISLMIRFHERSLRARKATLVLVLSFHGASPLDSVKTL